MSESHRFRDEKLILPNFEKEVWVKCPSCAKKAIATVDHNQKQARLTCTNCTLFRITSTVIQSGKTTAELIIPAHGYFDKLELWLAAPFKNDTFIAYNLAHLEYLEKYISALLREHRDRTHFTLLEKLPLFYHEAKNRDALLKIINKLKIKT